MRRHACVDPYGWVLVLPSAEVKPAARAAEDTSREALFMAQLLRHEHAPPGTIAAPSQRFETEAAAVSGSTP